MTTEENELDPVKERIIEYKLAIKLKVENASNFVINMKERVDITHQVNAMNSSTPRPPTASELWEGDMESIPFEPTSK